MDAKSFGLFLSALRKKNHVTQWQLGRSIGVSNRVISKWETGISLPDAGAILALAHFFGITADALLEERIGVLAEGQKERMPISPLTETQYQKLIAEKATGESMTQKAENSLIPPPSDSMTGDYFCTWKTQYDVAEHCGFSGEWLAGVRDALTAPLLFGGAEYHPLPREYRRGTIFLIDDGWDVPFGTSSFPGKTKLFGSLLPDEERFASFGSTPIARLRRICECVLSLGYAGTGLWVAAERGGEESGERRRFFAERARLHAEAGVRYWKVDWGKYAHDISYRRILSEEAAKQTPSLYADHCVWQPPLTEEGTDPLHGERRRETAELMRFSDVFRVYDVAKPFDEICTLDRLDEAFSAAAGTPAAAARGYVSVECPAIAAVFGCTLAIMRDSEAVRACLRFHRLSPPFGAYDAPYIGSEERLTDRLWLENRVAYWVANEKCMHSESAPAVMARGCPLPQVYPLRGEAPFVAASRNPKTGVYAIGAFRRNIDPCERTVCPAEVAMPVEGACVTIGVFGIFASLTLVYPQAIEGTVEVLCQYILSDTYKNVTINVVIKDNTLRILGTDLRTWGKAENVDHNDKDPACVLRITIKNK